MPMRGSGRLRAWAAASAGVLVSPGGRERAADLLGLDRRELIELPNGVDTDHFRRRRVDRREVWGRALVSEPRGWLPGQDEGTVRYGERELEALLEDRCSCTSVASPRSSGCRC